MDNLETTAEETTPETNIPAVHTLSDFARTALSKYYTSDELEILNCSIDRETAVKIHQSVLNLSTGAYSSIPRLCLGRKCPSQHTCPFIQAKLEDKIIGKMCPVEIMIVDGWKQEYDIMLRESNQDPNQIVIRNYVYQLIECDIVSMRLNHYLGSLPDHGGGEIVDSPFVVNPKTGALEFQKTENIALSIKGFINARREQAVKALMASPFWKKKMADNSGTDDLNANIDIFSRAKEAKLVAQSSTSEASYVVVDDDIAT